MKKLIILFTVLLLAFTACTAKAPEPAASLVPSPEPSAQEAPSPAPSVSAEPTPTPTPSEKPVLEDYEYVYTPYIIPELHRQTFDEATVKLAEDIMDAFIAHEESVPAIDEKTAQNALAIAVRCFPPFDAFAEFNEYTAFKDGTVSWKIALTEEEHEAVLEEFQQVIEEYMKVLKKGDSETARALALYREMLTGSKYDHSFEGIVLDYSPVELSSYYFLLNRSGICTGYAGAYAYLLIQAGINASDICGSDRVLLAGNPGTPHDWVIMQLEGKYYFADPTWELKSNELAWFGLSLQDRESEYSGNFPLEDMRICAKLLSELDLDISDTRFEEFHSMFGVTLVMDWRFNEDRTAIIYNDPSGDECIFEV